MTKYRHVMDYIEKDQEEMHAVAVLDNGNIDDLIISGDPYVGTAFNVHFGPQVGNLRNLNKAITELLEELDS